MKRNTPLIIFSDLDGTLLDHDSYSWDPARPALTRLAALAVPVILATSKTEDETAALQCEMGLSDYPAIVENGAGVIGLPGHSNSGPAEYNRLRTHLDNAPEQLRRFFKGFGDMSIDEVSQTTGLPPADAARAKTRRFSEPGLWSGTVHDRETLLAALAKQGISARLGGRFLTLSFGKTKRDGMAAVAEHFGAERTVALGDAPNDVEMLEAADIGVIIANAHSAPLPRLPGEGSGGIIRTINTGPTGWNDAVISILDELGLTTKDSSIG